MTTTEGHTLLAPLQVGSTYFIPKEARMLDHGLATITAILSPGVYAIQYPSGITETLTDTAEAAPCW